MDHSDLVRVVLIASSHKSPPEFRGAGAWASLSYEASQHHV